MGILSGLPGNAAEVDIEKLEQGFEGVLVDKQGLTGKKVDYHTIPYRAITGFSIETAGHFDTDSELKLWPPAPAHPLSRN
jgi:hypothetical protein